MGIRALRATPLTELIHSGQVLAAQTTGRSGKRLAAGTARWRGLSLLISVRDLAVDRARLARRDASAKKIEGDEVLLVGQILDRQVG